MLALGSGAQELSVALIAWAHSAGLIGTQDALQIVEHQQAAREAFAAAGIAHQRTRVIAGRALEVLPRMTDGAYDLMVVDADKAEYPQYVQQASRLLRPGGTLVLTWSDKESDPTARDPETRTLREVGRLIRDHDGFTASLLPVGDGLLVAVKG